MARAHIRNTQELSELAAEISGRMLPKILLCIRTKLVCMYRVKKAYWDYLANPSVLRRRPTSEPNVGHEIFALSILALHCHTRQSVWQTA